MKTRMPSENCTNMNRCWTICNIKGSYSWIVPTTKPKDTSAENNIRKNKKKGIIIVIIMRRIIIVITTTGEENIENMPLLGHLHNQLP